MSTTDKIKEEAIPALFAGGVAMGVGYYLGAQNFNVNVPLFGSTNAALVLGATAGAGHLGGAIATDYVLPKLQGSTYFEGEDKIVPPALAGLSTYAVMKVLINPDVDLSYAVGLGAGSSAAGIYTYDMMYN